LKNLFFKKIAENKKKWYNIIRRSDKMKKSLIFARAAIVSALLYIENYSIETDKYDIISDKIPESFNGYKILQLSDFHCKKFGNNNKVLIDKIIALNPDIILFTGDMVSREDRSFEPFYRLSAALAKRFPVYYTVGNHELDVSDNELKEMFEILREMGVKILNNESTIITKSNDYIELYGMWYNLRYYKDENGSYRHPEKFDIDEMKRLLGNAPSKHFSVLMAHNPLDFKVYAKWGADLTFSGHIHGGVIRLPVLGGLFSPGRRFLPKYYAGEYSIHDNKLIVSRGIGGPRILNRPSLVLVTLKNE